MSILILLQIIYKQECIKASDSLLALEFAVKSGNKPKAYHEQMRIGAQDDIVIFPGAQARLVLRCVDNSDYRLAGECHVHRMMYGDKFNEVGCKGAMRIFKIR